MRLVKFTCGLILTVSIAAANAQNHLNTFLSDISIKKFNLGSKLTDLKKDSKISSEMTELKFDSVTDVCKLENQKINFFDIEELDGVILNFKDDLLKSVVLEILDDPNGPEFEKTYETLKSRYGEPSLKILKDSSKIYTWKDNSNKLMLKQLLISFLIKYYD
jgi:hypothetical protein